MLLPSSGVMNNSELLQPLLQEILHEAELARSNPLPPLSYSLFRQFESNGDREQYQRVYFARRGRLAACAISAIIDDNPQHLELLQDTIWEICNEYTWCLPAHLEGSPVPPEQSIDLFAAETAHTLAEILTLLRDRLHSSIVERMCEEIERRIFQPMCMDSVRFEWETADHNWASVCGGAVGMAAMLLIDDKERLNSILNRVVGAMECFLDGYGDDGGCAEGIGYWVYGFGYFVYFAEMLEVYSSGQWDLMNQDKVKVIAGYPEAVHLSDGVYANYSDAPERVMLPTGLLSRLSARTDIPMPFPCVVPGFHDDHCYRWAHLSRNLWWTDEARFGGQPKVGVHWLDNLGVVVDHQAAGKEYYSTWLQRSELPNGSEYSLDLTHAYPVAAGISSYIRAFQWTATESICQLRIEDRFHFEHSASETYHIEERFISYLRPIISEGIVMCSCGSGKLTLHYNEQQFTAHIQTVQHQDHAANPITVYITSLIAGQLEQIFLGVFDFTIQLSPSYLDL